MHHYLKITFAVALIFVAAPTWADPLPSFEFRGHHIGEPIQKHFLYWSNGPRVGLRSPFCINSDETFSCGDTTVARKGPYGIETSYVGDVDINSLSYQFIDQKLIGLHMPFYTNRHPKIRSMLVGKYGEPTAERVEQVQNRAGAAFENLVSEWEFSEGKLILQMRWNKVDTGALIFSNPVAEREIAQRAAKRSEDQGKKAF